MRNKWYVLLTKEDDPVNGQPCYVHRGNKRKAIRRALGKAGTGWKCTMARRVKKV